MPPAPTPLHLAVVGAGPVGLALAIAAARSLPHARIAVLDARDAQHDVGADPRTLALALGSVQLFQRLGSWRDGVAQPIREVHVSQHGAAGSAAVHIRAADEGVQMLGAVLRYGEIVAPLQSTWLDAVAAEPQRLSMRLGARVEAIDPGTGGATIRCEGGEPERFDLVVVAEGGVFGDGRTRMPGGAALRRDYHQTAWVGTASFEERGTPGIAFERFTADGPLALLPLPSTDRRRAALVWCVPTATDPVRELSDAQRIAVLNERLPAEAGRIVELTPLKSFQLGLEAQRGLVQGRILRIGNAAQTLHPVAGQGLNLGLRDAWTLVAALRRGTDLDAALRRLEWQRAADRWPMIAATDFLARSFTWVLPGAPALRGAALAALERLGPAKSLLARQMMFGSR
jgi:2-octaprenyl-6-methoxyphenol hydroxylase